MLISLSLAECIFLKDNNCVVTGLLWLTQTHLGRGNDMIDEGVGLLFL